ncbi:unnamed protein product [Pleuronectes platessa]|uniref:Uncharacterized protein n=1 Tax=Pleuronectes platessa TaxID=8262 RepID=A0A9N7VHL8_PLEPL|nr:unnamed protein product [Pleuronectes platessa]
MSLQAQSMTPWWRHLLYPPTPRFLHQLDWFIQVFHRASRTKANHNQYSIAAPLQISRVTSDRLSPRVDLVLGAALSTSGGSSKWRDRTAHWVEMVDRSGLADHRGEGGGGGDAGMGNHNYPNFRRTASFNDTKPQTLSSAQSRNFRERSMTHVGSRTLPEGSCLTRGGLERQPYHAYPIPEHGTPDLTRPGPQRNDQRKPWLETAAPSRNSELKHTGANPNSISASEKDGRGGVIGTAERQRSGGPVSGGKEGLSGIGGLAAGPAGSHGVSQLSIEQAEINWNRRGPSPIQRNILARKLKEAQSCSGINGRQRSSTFSTPSSNQRQGRCHSLQMSGGYSNTVDSPYRLSEKEQRMLDLDLSSS